jgi:hypothetical protein
MSTPRSLALGALLLLALTGCGGKKREEAQARLEALRKEQTALESQELKALEEQLASLQEQLTAQEKQRAEARKKLLTVQLALVKSWKARNTTPAALAKEAKLPKELSPALDTAAEAVKEATRQGLGESEEARAWSFAQAVEQDALGQLEAALSDWEVRMGLVTRAPVEPSDVEEVACKQPLTAQASCRSGATPTGAPSPLPLLLCRVEAAKQWWVAAFDGERLSLKQLESVQGEPLFVDVDADGQQELLWKAEGPFQALHRSPVSGALTAWAPQQLCQKLAGRTDATLQPVLAACGP